MTELAMTTPDIAELAGKLTPLERERLIEWQGVAGAAYNVISGALCKAGLLNADWSHSPLGLAVRAHLTTPTPKENSRGLT